MVFLIQNTQNRDSAAVHLKLDELIRTVSGVHNACSTWRSSPRRTSSVCGQDTSHWGAARGRICYVACWTLTPPMCPSTGGAPEVTVRARRLRTTTWLPTYPPGMTISHDPEHLMQLALSRSNWMRESGAANANGNDGLWRHRRSVLVLSAPDGDLRVGSHP
jgi:Low affinity iron permease